MSRSSSLTLNLPTTARSMSSFDRGWDNDNYMDSLSGGNVNTNTNEVDESDSGNDYNYNNNNNNDAMDRANDEYYRQSRYGRPVVLDNDNGNGNGNGPSFSAQTNSYTSYAESLQQQNRQQQQQQQQLYQPNQQSPSFPPNGNTVVQNNNNDMSAVSDAAAEIYSYSYNKNVNVPAAGTSTSPDYVAQVDKEEASQGGSRFRDLLARAPPVAQQQQQQVSQQPDYSNSMPYPLLAATGDVITPPSSIMTPEELANLSVEEQARLYREFFYVQQHKKFQESAGTANANVNVNANVLQPQQQQQPQQQYAPKSIGSTDDNYLQAGIGFDGRKIGRNRDSDLVSNAGDVYFARLKKDSTTRNLARYSGDDQKANAVFHDPSIQDIVAPVNPYLVDQQQRMRDVIETVPEEMLVFRDYQGPEAYRQLTAEEMASYSGVSYKEKIAQKKQEREEQRLQQQQSQQQQQQSQSQPQSQNNSNNDGNSNNNNNYFGNGNSY